MKVIGLLGGMSWESSLLYYRLINEGVKAALGGHHSAECLLYSVDFARIAKLQHEDQWDELRTMMIAYAKQLKQGGAEFLLICTNTMHKFAGDIEREAGIKVLHIAQAAGRAITERHFTTVALLGTKYTMEQDFYKKVLNDEFGITVIVPEPADRERIHAVIYDELCQGLIRDESRRQYQGIITKLAQQGAQGVVLGCTEIPLLIQAEHSCLPIFDTTALHTSAAVQYALD